jgi:hypothetical protein
MKVRKFRAGNNTGFPDLATSANWTTAEIHLGKNDLRQPEKTAIPL